MKAGQKMRDLINILDLSTEEIDSLIERAKDIKRQIQIQRGL